MSEETKYYLIGIFFVGYLLIGFFWAKHYKRKAVIYGIPFSRLIVWLWMFLWLPYEIWITLFDKD